MEELKNYFENKIRLQCSKCNRTECDESRIHTICDMLQSDNTRCLGIFN